MTNDLISREAAIEILKEKLNRNYTPSFTAGDAFASALHRIKKLPTVDAAPVVHASYGFVGPHIGSLYADHGTCGNCKERILIDPRHKKFCPNCGAKMDGEERQ